MSRRPDPRIPEIKRRWADTIAKSERVMTMSRHLTLTRGVLADHLAQAMPAQLDFIESWFTAELASREQSKHARLPIRQRTPHAEHAENPLPKPRKNTAHNAGTNLPKHRV